MTRPVLSTGAVVTAIGKCERCDADLPRLDVTKFGDSEPQFVYGRCDCPRPRCPFCAWALITGKCMNIDCFMCTNVIPIPECA